MVVKELQNMRVNSDCCQKEAKDGNCLLHIRHTKNAEDLTCGGGGGHVCTESDCAAIGASSRTMCREGNQAAQLSTRHIGSAHAAIGVLVSAQPMVT